MKRASCLSVFIVDTALVSQYSLHQLHQLHRDSQPITKPNICQNGLTNQNLRSSLFFRLYVFSCNLEGLLPPHSIASLARPSSYLLNHTSSPSTAQTTDHFLNTTPSPLSHIILLVHFSPFDYFNNNTSSSCLPVLITVPPEMIAFIRVRQVGHQTSTVASDHLIRQAGVTILW
jgi:hypothetical protein